MCIVRLTGDLAGFIEVKKEAVRREGLKRKREAGQLIDTKRAFGNLCLECHKDMCRRWKGRGD